MKLEILIVNRIANQVVKKAVNVIPRVGDMLDMFYSPLPKVVSVILYPRPETLTNLDPEHKVITELDYMFIEAIIFVD